MFKAFQTPRAQTIIKLLHNLQHLLFVELYILAPAVAFALAGKKGTAFGAFFQLFFV
jgi:hypothetical protein